MSAVIVIKNKIVGLGFNQMKTHPFQAKFSKNKDSVYIHAEIHAIKNALRSIDVDDLRYADLYVTRVMNGNSKRGMSKPCEGCVGAIVEFGIKRVYYTDSEGKVLKL
jgi:tRNA(Arg) A34 adenosine deaminase TadA